MTLLLCGWALARDVVLYEGDPVPSLQAAAADLEVDPAALQPIRPGELPGGDTPLLFGRDTRFCSVDGAGNGALRDLVTRAEGHLAYQRTAEASAVLDTAAASLACLPEPIEASLAARIAWLRGVLALRSGSTTEAASAFRLAATFQPGLTWDSRFPPDTTGTFDAARVLPAASVEVPVGVGGTATLWVDGRAAATPLRLAPGRHYLQVLDGPRAWTALVEVAADPPLAVVTRGWLDTLVLSDLDETGRRLLLLAVRASLPGDTVYARIGGQTLRVDATWRVLPHHAVPRPVCAEGRRCAGVALLGAGAGVFASGGVGFVLAEARVNALAASPAGESAEAYATRVGAQDEAKRWLGVSAGLAGAGLVLSGVGVALELPGTTLTFTGTGLLARGVW
jgi:hypothetical protein